MTRKTKKKKREILCGAKNLNSGEWGQGVKNDMEVEEGTEDNSHITNGIRDWIHPHFAPQATGCVVVNDIFAAHSLRSLRSSCGLLSLRSLCSSSCRLLSLCSLRSSCGLLSLCSLHSSCGLLRRGTIRLVFELLVFSNSTRHAQSVARFTFCRVFLAQHRVRNCEAPMVCAPILTVATCCGT
jgi:hypothetical protein